MSKSKPQKEIPEELMTHYIVKDYQRMFLNHDALLEKIEELRRQLILKQREIDRLTSQLSKIKK